MTASQEKVRTAPPETGIRRPHDDEVDVHGLTHAGKVRPENQDHFLICSLRRQVLVHQTSLPDRSVVRGEPERLAFLAMVADGVGGVDHGEEASRFTLGAVTQYVAQSLRCYYSADPDDEEFELTLEEAALRCHSSLRERAEAEGGPDGMATTLTLWLGVWPTAYLLQVGDSRAYLFRDGELTQLSRDQTMAQVLIDKGVMTRTDAANTKWANVLSSAIGGPETAPAVTRFEQRWGDVGLLCSDGLTRHVSDDQIRDRLTNMTSAKQVCEQLLEDALAGGGSDNISIVVGRTVRLRE